MDDKLKDRITENIILYGIRDINEEVAKALEISLEEGKKLMVCDRKILFDLMDYQDLIKEREKQVANELFYKAALENLKRNKLIKENDNGERKQIK